MVVIMRRQMAVLWLSHGIFLVMKYAIIYIWQQPSRLGSYDVEQYLVH